MELIFWLFDTHPAPFWPLSIVGWLGWFLFLGLLIWLAWDWRHSQSGWNARNTALFAALAVLTLLTTATPGIRLPVGAALPLQNLPQLPRGPALMLLSALPLLLAGGMLGPVAALALGLMAGLLRFLWDTHSLYTGLELALLALLFGLAVRQRYRTRAFALLREPVIAALVLALLYAPLFVVDSFLVSSGSMAARLDYALAGAQNAILARAAELLIAGLFAQILVFAFPARWGRSLPLQPSPVERSLEARFLLGSGALILFLLMTLLAGDWLVAGAAARDMLHNRLKASAELASQGVPFFLETGQNLAGQIALRPGLVSLSGAELAGELGGQMAALPFFDQLMVFGPGAQLDGVYPPGSAANLYPEETAGLGLATGGVLSQSYSIPPAGEGEPARISFIIAIPDSTGGQSGRVLVARSGLDTNPLVQPLIHSLESVSALGGAGILLDESGRIIHHSLPGQLMSQYPGRRSAAADFFDDTAPDGTRSLVYYQPVEGRSWAVVLSVPAQQAQQLALTIAAPLFVMILVLALVALVSLRLGLKVITNSLQTLTNEAERIAQGQLDHALTIDGVDEVGQLRRSFEQMRGSLQARLEELNRLLLVSQGVASSLDMQDAVQPVMEAILATGASAVRVVLSPMDEENDENRSTVLALGPGKERFAPLDERVLKLASQQERVFLANVGRALGSARDLPVSLLAIALRHENRSYGVLWAGYEQPHLFSEQDIRFLSTLAGQAALAASNHALYRSAQVGRQRLAAILASTPDPVLVIDQSGRLLLANPAAREVLGEAVVTGAGQPIETVVSQKALLGVLQAASPDKLSAEVVLPGGQVYLATASPVVAGGRPVGRVCILRDVTHFKELDTMKTEFVNTVSHDLRSPLTLMRGYATMLEMVGTINEQQQGYVKKIISGVENMARLVNNLLDLGRVEAGVGLQLETVPLIDMVDRVTGPLQMLAAQKNIEMSVSTPKDTMPLIQADQALIQQAMYNLVENAIKYTPAGGKVDVRLKIEGDAMLFEVQDNGIGIAAADQPRLFEKFYRGGQREAREQKGSGLGLAIVRSIAERHGGRVWLESQLGRGSSFYLLAPLRQSN